VNLKVKPAVIDESNLFWVELVLPELDPLNENLRLVGLVGCVFVPEAAQNPWTPSIPAD
jgi:hypothetical protein